MSNLIIENKRDIRLDTMRGILLIIMTLNHLGGSLTLFAAQPFGYVTAAEGFIVLSGYTYAITSKLGFEPFMARLRTSGKRAFKIYKYHILAFALLLSIAILIPSYGEYFGKRFFVKNNTEEILWTIIGTLLLVHQPVYFDILPMYIVFALLSPLVLYA
ncbi:OpgC domain-containing protein [Massilia sp. HP4]|uniref:OpgC domain-containing protein n=1 Tax=Massilia sp. HP4 TaxID=2562316 RepID=UPI0014852E3F|nr:OpgC domain-containing protein [Massilia sp. HP4]